MIASHSIRVYNFLDYRDYLKEIYVVNKEKDKRFSYRVMAREMAFTSPNYCKLIIDKERHLGKKSIPNISQALQFTSDEEEYFSYLLFFSKAKTRIDKNYYFGLIASLRAPHISTTIDCDKYEYFSNWYNIVVRELINNQKAPIDTVALAHKITPTITPKEVQKSIDLLEKLALITINSDNRYELSSPTLNTNNTLSHLALKNYHEKMIELAKNSIDTHTSDKREIGATTITISEKGFSQIRERIQAFREEILQMVQDDTNGDRVMQFNMQFFPLTEEGIYDEQ